MDQRDALKSYSSTNINTANRGKLIILLYEGAIKNMKDAVDLMDNFKQYDAVNKKLKKVNDIIEELIGSLNKKEGGDLALRLESIYLYIFDLVFKANAEKNSKNLKESIKLMEDLLNAWRVAVDKENDSLDKDMANSRFNFKG